MADEHVKNSSRLAAWRGVRREELRNLVKAEKLMISMERIRIKAERRSKEMTANEVGALKLSLDAARYQLGKVLPDVKAVEHDPGEHTERLARDQINARLAELYAATHSRIDGSGSTGTAIVTGSETKTH